MSHTEGMHIAGHPSTTEQHLTASPIG